MTERYFVTGTDTEVGKTVASSALLQAANRAGYRTAGYKPVASGSEMTDEGLRNTDALALQRNSGVALSYAEVNPYTFEEPTSPHIVSEDEGRPVDAHTLSAGLHALSQKADWVLVEGAGGWYTPLSSTYTFADWVQAEQLPVILVVGVKLGCINHAVLTAQAVQQAGLMLAGWIANDVIPPGKRHTEYMATLTRMLPAPLLGEIPYLSEGPERAEPGQYLDLTALRPAS
ncbi:dethiobiotin synthase [Enterobacter sp. CC120223-11]|uniref:dethiobiotin synthase n=1 Tax=Enterobacter sp. CC120223-11 TaxID=1378073 RepID=UPI000BD54C84|nr:dethiobiotin synthase [Enterobacter sp. CC120223-11]SNY76960.1 dethiobiotin synthetase [Enterobacter sp. CC120223-11]